MDVSKAPDKWLRVDGSVVSCTESVKVLNENWAVSYTHLTLPTKA